MMQGVKGTNNKLEKTCLHCGKHFWIYPSVIVWRDGGKYCSKTCRNTAKQVVLVDRICEQCGEVFKVPRQEIRWHPWRFCSPKCSYESRVEPISERWTQNVDKGVGNDCWFWIGPKNDSGYGYLTRRGKRYLAHRLSWELHNGNIPKGMYICHRCDTPLCVRPDHLFAGTQDDNMKDAVSKGRMASGDKQGLRKHPERVPRGERSASAKLTEVQVLEIRRRYADGKVNQSTLGREYGVNPGTIAKIVLRQRWVHI